MAAILYGLVALLGVGGDLVLANLPPQSMVQGVVLALLVPGVPAVMMGGAFPLLFSVLDREAPRWHSAALVAANLAGSVIATFVGGNFAIPTLGLAQSAWIGAAAYGATALLVAVRSRSERRMTSAEAAVAPPLAGVGRAEFAALSAGFVVLALEVMMLRRLPFFLDGFQPTLSGVLAACLLGLTLGAMFGPPLFTKWFRHRAPGGSVVVAVLIAALGFHEWVAPLVGRVGVESDYGFHLRIVLAAFIAAGLPCFCLGATVPLCLAEFVHPETRAQLAGRLFFFQGVGSLLGAVAVGHVLPRLLPGTFFIYGVAVVLLIGLLLVARRFKKVTLTAALGVVILGATGVTGGTVFRHSDAPVAGSRYDRPGRYRYLEHRTDEVVTASVVYDRRSHGMILFTDEFRAAYIDPDSGYMKVLGHLPFLLREKMKRVAVIALGTGTTANAVHLWPDPEELHVVEISAAVVSLVDHFGKDGPATAPVPAPFRVDPRTRTHVTDGRRFIARRPAGSLDLISMEPLLPYAPGTVPLYTREFYRYCAQALSDDGLIVQWVPTHSMPASYFRTLLATFARGFDHHSVWLFNHSTLLIGSKRPHLPPIDELRQRMNEMPPAARRDLHAAGIAAAGDLIAAMVGTDALRVCTEPDLNDDRPFLERLGYWSAGTKLGFLPQNLAVLREIASPSGQWPGVREWRGMRIDRMNGLRDLALGATVADQTHNSLAVLALGRTRARLPESVLLHGELRRAQRALAEKVVASWCVDRATFDRVADGAFIRRHLAKDPGSAFLWAAAAPNEEKEIDQHSAMRTAQALDPTIYDSWPQLRLAWVPAEEIDDFRGPFESMALLPKGEALVRHATASSPDGTAFRVRFRVPVGYACLELLAARELTPAEATVLRGVLDPALLTFAQNRVEQRDGDLVREVLPLWRRDLAVSSGLSELARGNPAQRRAFAAALSGRKGAAELALLARLLMDADLAVRRVAGVSLFQTVGDRVTYDPEADAATRQKSVEQLRELR